MGEHSQSFADATAKVLDFKADSGSDVRRAMGRQQEVSLDMTKAEIVAAVASASGLTKADAEKAIGAFLDQVVDAAVAGDKVNWPGFGAFSVSQRAARAGRNPKTGEVVEVKASSALKFSPSSALKAKLNPGR
jgi:DNA-binding protein HU-beta